MSLLKRLEQQDFDAPAQKTNDSEENVDIVVTQKDTNRQLKEQIRVQTIEALNNVKETGEKVVRETLNEVLADKASSIPRMERSVIADELYNDIMGYGPLEELLADPEITEIMINGYKQVFVEKSGKLTQIEVNFRDQAHLLNIIDRIVSTIGRHVDEASPMVDARLKDGSRVNVIIPPLS